MPRLDIWSHASGTKLRDTISSLMANLLLAGPDSRPAYFSSPWMSDFPVFRNEFRQYSALLGTYADSSQLLFSQYLSVLGQSRPIRIITVLNATSSAFAEIVRGRNCPNIDIRFAPESYHEKGILSSLFYMQGSMNLTYSGLYVRDEKVSLHVGPEDGERELIGKAHLEFARFWELIRGVRGTHAILE